MKRVRFRYPVQTELELTRAELQLLIKQSQKHYDRMCNRLGEQGGLLYGWQNKMAVYEEVKAEDPPLFLIDIDDLDLLVKCCEIITSGPEATLYVTLRTLLTEAGAEWARLNASEGETK